MFVCLDEKHVSHLIFEMDSQGFDSVTHGICGRDPWDIGQRFQDGSLLWRFLKVAIVVVSLPLFQCCVGLDAVFLEGD